MLFDALAAPKPQTGGVKDPRSAGQRRHDALLDMLTLVERAQLLPATGGISATIVLTMDADTYATGHGTASTGHGYPVPADVATRWAGQQARIIAVLLSKTKGIEAYSSTHRIFTEQQRLALLARDHGCSFPGCDTAPQWCEAHHLTDYRHSKHTRVDDAALLCRYHHDHHTAMGWTGVMINGRPHWTPPRWIDPTRTPRRNTMHDKPLRT